ncbi:MrcB family domain-containing protein [Fodinibius salsisoli]|uniref:DUF3578 domain-containing protein n=1 Tax=Fodinibius salsisoli TaxID=2820877 RepID=A0ABT3PS83_9BACT|nr:DUF3578 domain-containing protein [Fodinibius salsisoli]MCW9708729.1 DUF3578 domain-containing protein [Fodinibius salsisoli]
MDFTKEQIQKAIQQIDENPNLLTGRNSYKYDLVHDGKRYPPILVLSEANKLDGGDELLLSDFGNSTKKPFKILRDKGFKIQDKKEEDENFIPTLEAYIDQALTGSLKTSKYRNEFRGLTVKVSFGQGTPTHVPWISFLGSDQSTSKGIYPVFLYYKKKKILVLAYGVSETNEPNINWDLDNPKSIEELFSEKNWGEPFRYGSSFVYSYYDLNHEFSKKKIHEDLNKLVKYYKEFLAGDFPRRNNNNLNLSDFVNDCKSANLNYSQKLCNRFIYSLCTKPFIILTGLSGSGKTKIAQAFSKWISEDDEQICIVPVGADWTNREPLLGYPNALKDNGYEKPDSGILDLIIKASDNRNKPFFLILDEMNLSHVERYFADFLSAMESGDEIKLHSGKDDWEGVPPTIDIPDNLFVIGTVNIDETTYMFSPKVLDRANVIEFRVTSDELENFLQEPQDVDIDSIKRMGASLATKFIQIANTPADSSIIKEELNTELINFFNELKKVGAEFGYRSAHEIQLFAGIASRKVKDWSNQEITDIVIVQKILPKLHGSRRKLEPILRVLASLCIKDDASLDNILDNPYEFDFNNSANVKYPISLEKIVRMHNRLLENGFTSFAEA